MKLKSLLSAALVLSCFVAMSGFLPRPSQANSKANELILSTNTSASQTENPPRITKALMEKKTLTVEGENFVDGTKLYVNGTKVKSFNDEITPTTKLVVNKANKRLPIDEVVSLQVATPDGQLSEVMVFFTGITFTAQNAPMDSTVSVRVGRKFLINFKDDGIYWQIYFPPSQSPNVEFVPCSSCPSDWQGVYYARQTGFAPFILRGEKIGERPFFYYVNLAVDE
jgi:hypothetical protein